MRTRRVVREMRLVNIFCYYFIYTCLNLSLKSVSGDESQQTCAVELKNSMPTLRGVRNIELAIDAGLKQETINSRQQISELVKAEFALQREELLQLAETVKEEIIILKTCKNELDEQKNVIKNLINNELPTQQQAYQKHVKSELDSVCGTAHVAQSEKLSEAFNSNFSNQKKAQEKLVEDVSKAIVPTQIDSSRWAENFNCTKNCGPIMDLPASCEEAMSSSFSKDGVYLLHITDSHLKPFFAYCKRIDGKVWTIMQRREDGLVDFYRNWQDYKLGFGNLYGELWLGLERIHVLTTKYKHKLHMWMENKQGKSLYAQYNQFSVANETEKYRLKVGDFSGSAYDRLHNGTNFSTKDQDNDNTYGSHAMEYKGAWWFGDPYISHLNAPYYMAGENGIDWKDFDSKLKYTQMAIRRV